MKTIYNRILCLIALCTAFHSVSTAQSSWDEHKNNVKISFGAAPLTPYLFEIGDNISADLGPYERTTYHDNRYYFPALCLSYGHRFNRLFELEGSIGYSHVRQDIKNIYTDNVKDKIRCHYLSFIPVARLHWFNHGHFSMYSAGGLGVSVSLKGDPFYEETVVAPAFNLTYFGVSYSLNRFFCFAEAGVSSNGLFTIGGGYRF